MRKLLQSLVCFAFLMAPMAAHAEMSTAPDGKRYGGWENQQSEVMPASADTRAAMQTERDRLKMQCMNVKGQDRTACEKRMNELREREASMQSRAAYDEGDSQDRKWKENKANWKKGKAAPDSTAKKAKKRASPAYDSEAPTEQ